MDRLDRRLLDLVQSHLPLTERPYEGLGLSLGLSEEEVLSRLQRLKAEGLLRQIGAIFDSSRLGYQSTLAAFEVEPAALDRAARRLNEHPGISHNYARRHRYNLWFTLTLPGSKDLETETARLAAEVKAKDSLYLPALAIFKIGVRLKFSEENEEGALEGPVWARSEASAAAIEPLSPLEIRTVRALQADLPLVPRPFQSLANQARMEEGELLNLARRFLQEGVMRRFAATLHHQRAGFLFNFLTLWRVADDLVAELGRRMAAVEAVSHCYQRYTYPHWPYPLYAMFHAQTKEEADAILKSLIEATGLSDCLVLETIKEYKKERFQYFQEGNDGPQI